MSAAMAISLGVDPRLVELALKAPDLYEAWLQSLAQVEIPPRGPRGSPQNFERVKRMWVAYADGFEEAWRQYKER